MDRSRSEEPTEAIARIVAEEAAGLGPVVHPERVAEVLEEEGPQGLRGTRLTESEPDPAPQNASADLIPRRRRLGFSWPSKRIAVALGLIFLLAFSGVAYATYDYDQAYSGRILPGTEIAGVDVGGMSRADALAAVDGASRIQLDRTIEVSWEKRSWRVTPRKLGARSNAVELANAAVAASERTNVLKKAGMAVLGHELSFQRDLAITYPRQGVRGFVEGVASSLDREPVDASIDYSTGWVEIAPEQEGRKVLTDASRRALYRALRTGDDSVDLRVKTTAPAVTADDFDQILLLRIGENKLYLYDDGKITHTYTVATGQPEYPTPTGIYEITEKRYMPTWVNPDPTGWGASMPASIPPGPGNPLGTRALNWSASGIRFHGTEATYSLGYNASHGCVRMSMPDVEELYDLIEVGTPIVSLVASPLDPLYAAAPDPVVVEEDAGDSDPSTDAGEG